MFHCPCGYRQDFQMTEEAVHLHFPKIRDLKAGQCPQCRSELEPKDIAKWLKADSKNLDVYDEWLALQMQKLCISHFIQKQITRFELQFFFVLLMRDVYKNKQEAGIICEIPDAEVVASSISFSSAVCDAWETYGGTSAELVPVCQQLGRDIKAETRKKYGKERGIR